MSVETENRDGNTCHAQKKGHVVDDVGRDADHDGGDASVF